MNKEEDLEKDLKRQQEEGFIPLPGESEFERSQRREKIEWDRYGRDAVNQTKTASIVSKQILGLLSSEEVLRILRIALIEEEKHMEKIRQANRQKNGAEAMRLLQQPPWRYVAVAAAGILPWITPKKKQFERAIGLSIGAAKLARSEKIARDVVFFYAPKTRLS